MELLSLAVAVPIIALGIKGYVHLNSRLAVIEVMLKLLLKHNGGSDESIKADIVNELSNRKNRRTK